MKTPTGMLRSLNLKNTIKSSVILIGALLGTEEQAIAAQPPDVVTSDALFNTAMGSKALFNNSSGQLNTASGVNALFNNTTGSRNTADGLNALYSNFTGS